MQEVGQCFIGTAWRAESNLFCKGKTALEIVDFERVELGNDETMASAVKVADLYGFLLQDVPEEDVVWVTKSKAEADDYNTNAAIYPLGKYPLILATDPDGGYLVLKNANQYIPAVKL